MTQPILIAFPKGRLGDELVPLLEGTPLALDAKALKSRVLRIPTATPDVSALLLKGAMSARQKVGLKLNAPKDVLESIIKILPAENSPSTLMTGHHGIRVARDSAAPSNPMP